MALLASVTLAQLANVAGIAGAGVSLLSFLSRSDRASQARRQYEFVRRFQKKHGVRDTPFVAPETLADLAAVREFIWSSTQQYAVGTFVASLIIIGVSSQLIPLDLYSDDFTSFENFEKADIGLLALIGLAAFQYVFRFKLGYRQPGGPSPEDRGRR